MKADTPPAWKVGDRCYIVAAGPWPTPEHPESRRVVKGPYGLQRTSGNGWWFIGTRYGVHVTRIFRTSAEAKAQLERDEAKRRNEEKDKESCS